MKKSNIILAVALVAISIFLLWLWFALGFNQVDSPFDLLLSILWWAVIALGIFGVVKFEKARQRQIRTAYITADGRLYNSEAGMTFPKANQDVIQTLAETLANLEYGFKKADAPTNEDGSPAVEFAWVVRTETYKPARNSAQGEEREMWRGEVVEVATGTERKFGSRAGLAAFLA